MASHKALLIAAAATMSVVVAGAMAESSSIYKVGDAAGWGRNVNYVAWASGKTFSIGDTLEFVYSVGSHNVVIVDAASYEACTVPSNAHPRTSGDDRVMFYETAPTFFISSIKDDCQSGMKLAVNVQ